MNKTFDTEMERHVEALSAVEKNVRIATKSLAERRQQVDAARSRLAPLEQVAERAANAKRALESEKDWTCRVPLNNESTLPPAFGILPPLLPGAESETKLPELGEANLVTLRRLDAWEDRAAKLLEERAAELEGDGAERAVQYRKVIALCAKVPVERVDTVSDRSAEVQRCLPADDGRRVASRHVDVLHYKCIITLTTDA